LFVAFEINTNLQWFPLFISSAELLVSVIRYGIRDLQLLVDRLSGSVVDALNLKVP